MLLLLIEFWPDQFSLPETIWIEFFLIWRTQTFFEPSCLYGLAFFSLFLMSLNFLDVLMFSNHVHCFCCLQAVCLKNIICNYVQDWDFIQFWLTVVHVWRREHAYWSDWWHVSVVNHWGLCGHKNWRMTWKCLNAVLQKVSVQ